MNALRQDIETEKANLLAAMREWDPNNGCTIPVVNDALEVWHALFQLFDEGLCGFALTPVGIRFFRRGRITEAEIKARFGDAYVSENKMFGINEPGSWSAY